MVWYVALGIAVLVLVGYYLLPETDRLPGESAPTTSPSLPHAEPGELLAESASS
jgi:hypothetical protein